jgi:hypothetical protein
MWHFTGAVCAIILLTFVLAHSVQASWLQFPLIATLATTAILATHFAVAAITPSVAAMIYEYIESNGKKMAIG